MSEETDLTDSQTETNSFQERNRKVLTLITVILALAILAAGIWFYSR